MTVKAKFWVVFGSRTLNGNVIGVTARRMTQMKPPKLEADEVAFPFNIELDSAWFERPTPTVSVDLGKPDPDTQPSVQVTRARPRTDATRVLGED